MFVGEEKVGGAGCLLCEWNLEGQPKVNKPKATPLGKRNEAQRLVALSVSVKQHAIPPYSSEEGLCFPRTKG